MIETLKTAVGWIVILGFIAALLLLLWAIVRFSILSPKRTKGARTRLRKPEPSGIKSICGFEPPADLISLYEHIDFIERTEFYLVNRQKTPPQGWFIGGFFPLSPLDVQENRRISNVPGIPIADDLNKGTYFISEDGAVILDTPNKKGRRIAVAASVSTFSNFEAVDTWQEET